MPVGYKLKLYTQCLSIQCLSIYLSIDFCVNLITIMRRFLLDRVEKSLGQIFSRHGVLISYIINAINKLQL